MTLRRKTRRKATFQVTNEVEVIYVKDCGDYFKLRKFRDNGGGFTEYGSEAYIGKALVGALHNLTGQYYGFGGTQ